MKKFQRVRTTKTHELFTVPRLTSRKSNHARWIHTHTPPIP
uniref:Uncharacterized protein n=1 Tax=Anopheles minimus TaxID=112268 RepID=A0A182WHM7_9DIPT